MLNCLIRKYQLKDSNHYYIWHEANLCCPANFQLASNHRGVPKKEGEAGIEGRNETRKKNSCISQSFLQQHRDKHNLRYRWSLKR